MEVHQRLSSHYYNDLTMAEDSGNFIEKMMELGIGMSMIQQMPAMINSVMPQPNAQGSAPTPPPRHILLLTGHRLVLSLMRSW